MVLAGGIFYAIIPKIPTYWLACQTPIDQPMTLADELHNRDVRDARRKIGLD